MSIPIIDFAPFLSGTKEDRQRVSTEVFTAASTVGFLMLENFGLPPSAVSEAFERTKAFFALDLEAKEALAWESAESNRGFVRMGRERVTQATTKEEVEALRSVAPDLKETMEIGKDYDCVWPNRWPDPKQAPGFRSWATQCFESCHLLHLEVMRALAMGMGLGEGFFDEKVDQKAHNLRLRVQYILNYPPVSRDSIESAHSHRGRAGAHSDYGTITLLFQDMVGGLEVQDKQGNFVPVVPVPDTVVVNIGDLLQRWSNGVLRSTIHRVVVPPAAPGARESPQRNSIAFFSNPNLHQIIECLPGTGIPQFEPVESQAYLVSRLTATYD